MITVTNVLFSLKSYNKLPTPHLLGQVIEAPQPNLALVEVPGTFSFHVNVFLRGIEEIDEIIFRFTIRRNDSILLTTGNVKSPGGRTINNPYVPKDMKPRFLSFFLNDILFEEVGTYAFDIHVNDELVKTDTFGVYSIPKGGSESDGAE